MNRHNGTLLLTLLFLAACGTTQGDLPHFREIATNVVASGQPTALGFQQLKAKYPDREITILKLNFPEEGSDDGARALGMRVLDLGISPRTDKNGLALAAEIFIVPNTTTWTQIGAAVRAIPRIDDQKRLWLIHCVHGDDRTGLVVGYVLHTVLGWSKEDAFREMLRQGYHVGLLGLDYRWLEIP
jgi:hypothetical protein